MPTMEVLLSFAAIFGASTGLLVIACRKYARKIEEGKSPDQAYQEALDETLDK